ncbi:MAG TPA: hypothetical protein EYP14_16200, partial [Planctomycetaceae bacterium]|nr:hypothetical protein [Planctomycetaceae bacterium]
MPIRKTRYVALGVFLTAAALLAAFHQLMLLAVGRALIVDESMPKANVLWVRGGDRRYDVAAEWYRQDPLRHRLLLV